jgi:two-component system, OmpR family, response regulator
MSFTKSIKKIFIVDDDEMLQAALEDYITRRTPYEVVCFGTGEECMKNLSQGPDVIIIDYYLNSVDKNASNGLETMEAIKKHYNNIHFIMLSSQERYGIALQSLQKGAEQYVIKDEDAYEKIVEMLEALD